MLAGGRLAGLKDLRRLLEYIRYSVLQWDRMNATDRIQIDLLSRKEFVSCRCLL